MKKIAYLLRVLAFAPLACYAQFGISGIVTDNATGESLSGAHLILKETFKNTVSDPTGHYRFTDLKKGSYVLIVSYVGYLTLEQKLDLQNTLTVNIALESSPIMEDVVIIQSTRANVKSPDTYTNISKKAINEINLGRDLPYILSSTPSLTINSDAGNGVGYTSMQIRGTDMTRINVTINGIPLNDPESQNVFWVDLPELSSSIDNIQVQRGVGTSTNGAAAFGASVNIQTTTVETEPYARIDGTFGSFNTLKNNIMVGTGLLKNKFTFNARLSKISSDGYIDRASSDLKSYFVSGGFYGNKTIFKINVFSGDEKTYQAWEGIPSDILDTNRTYNPAGKYINDNGQVRYYDNQTDNYKQDHFQLLLSQEIGKCFLVNLAAHYTKGKGYYESYMTDQKLLKYGEDVFVSDSGVTRSDLIRQKWLDNDFSGMTFSLLYDNHKRIKLTFGGAWSTYNGDHYGFVIWAKDALITDKDRPYYKNIGRKSDGNIYLKAEYTLAKKINLFADMQLRMIDYSIKGTHDNLANIDQQPHFDFFNPKTGVLYEFSDRHKAYFSFGIAHREPNRRNYLDADPGHIPASEKLFDYELGYDLSLSKAKFGINLYYMNYKNQLVLTGEINNVGDPIMVNVPESYRIGAEITAGARIMKNLEWDANITLSRNKIHDFTEYIDNWDSGMQDSTYNGTTDLSFSPEIIFHNLFRYEPVKNLTLTLESTYIGKQYIDNTSNDNHILEPYFLNNFRINYSIVTPVIRNINITLMANNIFNTDYETNAWIYKYNYEGRELYVDGYFPQAGINFMAGLTLLF
ncbi:MAG: TonB-dependent receptor [Bacteroidetes bacterium]|nr:TonB-dependent receptor [Bacteroidota bacterium]